MEDNKKNEKQTDAQLDEITRQAEEMQNLISQVQGPGYTALLWRVSPTWCEGYLEEIEIDPDSGFDMNYIIRKWGGKKINVKLKDKEGKFRKQATLKLKSFPPRRHGELIDPYDELGGYEQNQPSSLGKNAKHRQMPVLQPSPPIQPPANQFDPNKMMEIMVGMVKDMQKQTADPQPAPLLDGARSVPDDPFGQLMSGLKTFKEMQKVFGTGEQLIAQANPEGENDSNLFGAITQILGMMTNRQQAPQPPPQPAPPAHVLPPRAPVVRNDLQNPSAPAPVSAPAQAPDLAGAIASLNPAQIGDIIVAAASRMDPEQRENAFAEVATRLAGLEGVEYDDDDLSGDDIDDVDESSTPPTNNDPD